MTRLLEQAMEVARNFSPEKQDEVAWGIFAMDDEEKKDVYVLSAEEEAAIDVALKQAERGEFATDEEMEALWAKYT